MFGITLDRAGGGGKAPASQRARRRMTEERWREAPGATREEGGLKAPGGEREYTASHMVQHGYTPRRSAGLAAYENALARAGLAPVAGIDEAGRGACAGPLVVAAVVLDQAAIRRMPQLADSKLLTPAAREDAYAHIMRRALDWHVVTIPAGDIDKLGLHVCNVEGMRRAFAGLRVTPRYVLTDGFPVRGLGLPALAVWKGDRVAASVAAASIVAKVTRDRMMCDLDERYPQYGFCRHKGYVTDEHLRTLAEFGACPEHRRSFRCVPEDGRLGGELGRVEGEELT
jgi:ribonuclease HII